MRGKDRVDATVGGRRSRERLIRLFDWLSALPADEAPLLRAEIIGTVMLRPVALLLSSAGILLMSATAALLLHRVWAIAWFATDLVMLAVRLGIAVRFQRRGRRMPE